ncbi:hypothetical protein GIB67_015600 [Kingdonia uniflora]|uniref:Acyl-coenzyme A oxidase n=1 Tax=Kingdonia uniflora TaxID=39325 RepID=A0A7J7LUE2_9MAGN|nr:hypothetical protein GIB67_015600 [Kingdonia uniflora]
MEEVDHLADERSKAQFDVEAMKIVWAGSQQQLDVSERIARLVASDPAFRKDNRTTLSRKDLFKNTLRKAAHAWKRIIELRLSEQEASMLRFYVDEPAFTDLHWCPYSIVSVNCCNGMPVPPEGMPCPMPGDTVDMAAARRPVPCTAVGMPWLVPMWWPGGLGKASTHGVVYARLLVDGKDHGVNGFIVQLRSLDDHSPLPGITVADIGMKFGNGAYNTMDNGVLRFDHVRIPRDQMLMRVSQVTREGKYVQSDVPRQLLYGTMVYVRQTIVADASCALSRAVCIATRYSAVRRQFGSQDGGPETQVIDYKTQQNRLFPLVASAYAYRFVGEWLKWLYTDVTQRLQANDFSTLPEAHACTAGLKSLTTSTTADAIEECRKLCGGHGYLCSSGLPELFAVYVPACTYEGDNVVLLLQVARFLMKTVSQLGSGKQPVGTTAYMGRVEHLLQSCSDVQQAEDWLKPTAILEAFEARAARMSVACARNISKMPSQEEGFAELSSDLVETAVAHCQLIVVHREIETGHTRKGSERTATILCNIYALFLLHKHQGEFLATGAITPKQASLASDQLRVLYAQARPNAIALVDAFNYTDHYLGSVLGRYDGNVYPNLYAKAWEDPLNDTVVPDGYREYIRPMLKQQLRTARL